MTINQNTLKGIISAHPRGFGFVRCEDGQEHFVPPPQMKWLIPGDTVAFTLTTNPRNQQLSAVVLEVLERPETFWLGQVVRSGPSVTLQTDDAVHTVLRVRGGAGVDARDVVQVRVPAGAGVGSTSVDVDIVENLGPRNDRDFDVRYAVAKWRLPTDFPSETLAELQDLEEPTLQGAQSEGLKDLTSLPLVTIDGDSTKDFDDAVALEDQGHTWVLHVAIADVSRYVKPGSALDTEAKRRATSVYLSDRTLPMLPKELSNGLCSLNPGQLRHALVCSLTYSKLGRLEGYAFARALIRSAARLTYQQVADDALPEGTPAEVSAMLSRLWSWYETQAPLRAKRGLMEGHGAEPKLKIEEDGSYGVEWVSILRSNELVEECMLAANRAAAAHLTLKGEGMLFRHQEGLDPEKWAETRAWLESHNISAPDVPTLRELRAVLSSELGELREQATFRIRRCMTPAVYDGAMSSHFSLDFHAYTHFTSPIRRYADLLVHRLLLGEPVVADSEATEHISARAKRAKQASRFPWERLKRRLVWRSGEHLHDAQVIGQTARGFKAAVLCWEVLIAVDAEGLEQAGWTWNAVAEQWQSDAGTLSVGQTVRVKLTELKDEGPTCELNAKLLAE
jgi:ribonuclease R